MSCPIVALTEWLRKQRRVREGRQGRRGGKDAPALAPAGFTKLLPPPPEHALVSRRAREGSLHGRHLRAAPTRAPARPPEFVAFNPAPFLPTTHQALTRGPRGAPPTEQQLRGARPAYQATEPGLSLTWANRASHALQAGTTRRSSIVRSGRMDSPAAHSLLCGGSTLRDPVSLGPQPETEGGFRIAHCVDGLLCPYQSASSTPTAAWRARRARSGASPAPLEYRECVADDVKTGGLTSFRAASS
jgi:hypothetical protein